MSETMTMRDQFAAQVLPAIWGGMTHGGPLAAASISYAVADAMLQARQLPTTSFNARSKVNAEHYFNQALKD